MAGPQTRIEVRLEGAPEPANAARLLAVALSNLLRNAALHTESKRIRLRVDNLRADVRDEGPGFPPAVIEQLGASGPRPDVGLGLATVERICHRYGWRLELDNPPGGGARATIDFDR